MTYQSSARSGPNLRARVVARECRSPVPEGILLKPVLDRPNRKLIGVVRAVSNAAREVVSRWFSVCVGFGLGVKTQTTRFRLVPYSTVT